MTLGQIVLRLKRFGLDAYMLMLVSTVVLAALWPASGQFAVILSQVTYWAIALLFFLYGTRLSLESLWAGMSNWRLQLSVLAMTFALFPVLTIGVASIASLSLPAAISVGYIYLGCLPSTVQSAIVFTAVSRGNVAGAVCAASFSNLIGVIVAPALFALLISSGSDYAVDLSAIEKIFRQILLPFFLGNLMRPLVAGFVARHKPLTTVVDRGSILLIVYSAFSAGVVNGIWDIISHRDLLLLVVLSLLLLGLVLGLSILIGRMIGLSWPDQLALLYCGSTKSLATGLPMAGILFAGQQVSLIIVPLMLFHLIQLAVCAVISQRVAARLPATVSDPVA